MEIGNLKRDLYLSQINIFLNLIGTFTETELE